MFELLERIWSKDGSSYPAGGPVVGWFGFWLKIKCSICIVLRREGDDPYGGYDSAPVYVSPWYSYHSYDGPGASWNEIAVDIGWKRWRYYEYTNGI
jgi:hypothetical protein